MADLPEIAPQTGAEPFRSLSNASPNADTLDPDQLQRLTGMVANGEIDPVSAAQDLSPQDQRQMETTVRRIRHARLVRLIAQQIAWDIRTEREHE